MTAPLAQHQAEIERNLRAWEAKPLLKDIYAGFYRRILALIDPAIPGRIVEIGSGIGNLKAHLPGALATDLFPNPWLDLVCDGYELPFRQGSLSHLVLFDVFHHLRAPNAFLREARRVLVPDGAADSVRALHQLDQLTRFTGCCITSPWRGGNRSAAPNRCRGRAITMPRRETPRACSSARKSPAGRRAGEYFTPRRSVAFTTCSRGAIANRRFTRPAG